MLESFTFLQGPTQRLVALRGSISVIFQGFVHAHICLQVWAMPYHPKGPPLIFILSDDSMPLRPNHPHVDHTTGMVYVPYLSQWDPRLSCISDAVQATISAISSSLPLYANSPLLALPAPTLVCTRASPTAPAPVDCRRELIYNLSKRLLHALTQNSTAASAVMSNLQRSKENLISRLRMDSERHNSAPKAEMASLLARRTELNEQAALLSQWRESHPYVHVDASIDVDTQPRHTRQQQVINCTALDYASDDVMDQLDEALCEGIISVSTYVIRVRRIARDQFFARALLRAIQQESIQAKVAEESRLNRGCHAVVNKTVIEETQVVRQPLTPDYIDPLVKMRRRL